MFDPTGSYRLSPRVGLRPEPFGALAYHFDTRRLVFLKSTELVALVEALAGYDSATAAIETLAPNRRASFEAALVSLCESGVIEPVPFRTMEEVA